MSAVSRLAQRWLSWLPARVLGAAAPEAFDNRGRSAPAKGQDGLPVGPAQDGEALRQLDGMLSTYPSNQVFSVRRGALVPGRKLARRLQPLLRLYPGRLDSLLDIGCAQGFFVLEAARRFPEARIVGVDAVDSYRELWDRACSCLGLSHVRFHVGLLHEFAQDLGRFGGPFQTVLLINTYHYLYFGSGNHPFGYRDHTAIFRLLRGLCSERLIWSSPLENKDCPGHSQRGSSGDDYSPAEILGSAREFFTVEDAGLLGKRPLYLMRAKQGSA